jgi:hypothetical protein
VTYVGPGQVQTLHLAIPRAREGILNPVQSPVPGVVTSGNGEQGETLETRKNPEEFEIPRGSSGSSEDDQAPPVGLEGAPDSPSPPSDLAFLIERWSTLTPALRAQIVALAESEAGGLSLAAEGAPFGCSQIFWFASCHLQDRFPWN